MGGALFTMKNSKGPASREARTSTFQYRKEARRTPGLLLRTASYGSAPHPMRFAADRRWIELNEVPKQGGSGHNRRSSPLSQPSLKRVHILSLSSDLSSILDGLKSLDPDHQEYREVTMDSKYRILDTKD